MLLATGKRKLTQACALLITHSMDADLCCGDRQEAGGDFKASHYSGSNNGAAGNGSYISRVAAGYLPSR